MTYVINDTYYMEQCSTSEANWFSASQGSTLILWKPKVHYRISKARHLSIYWALLHYCSKKWR